ncbi:MAG: hypothetical protein ACOC6B_01215 [Thermodesulfobacteriota bacterium]
MILIVDFVNDPEPPLKRITVLRVIARLNIGGPAIHVHLLTKGLDAKKFKSILIAGKISPTEGDMSYLFNSMDYKPILFPELQREINPKMDICVFKRIFTTLMREKPDIVPHIRQKLDQAPDSPCPYLLKRGNSGIHH